jgi:hypothetical protein
MKLLLLSAFRYHGDDSIDLIPFLRRALESSDEGVRTVASDVLRHRGHSLGGVDREQLEMEVQKTPEDRALRVLLLGYYSPRTALHEGSRQAYREHLHWLIANAPEYALPGFGDKPLTRAAEGEAKEDLVECWEKQVLSNPANAAVLRNASFFFRDRNPRLSLELLKRLHALVPGKPECQQMSSLYRRVLNESFGPGLREEALRAVAELEDILKRSIDHGDRRWVLQDIGNIAIEGGDLEKANSCALELSELPSVADRFFPEIGAANHHANLIWGRIALKRGDVDAAKCHLQEAARTEGSPLLDSLGPNMMLAKELLEKGERDAVVNFLRLCGSFWQTPEHRAEQWIFTLQQGGQPDFANNLYR